MNTTTKRFPRTSQRDPWRGVITRHRPPIAERIYDVLLATAIGVCLAAVLVHWWSS